MTLYASHTTLHKTDIKFFTKTQSPPTRSKFSHKAALQAQNSARTPNFFPLLHIPNSPLPNTLPSSPLDFLLCHQSIFTSTTSSHCRATSRAKFPTHSFSSYFLLSFLDLHQSSRYLTSSFMQKFKPLDSLKLSRTAKSIVLPYLQLLPTHFAYSRFYCRGLIFTNLFYNAELSRTPRSYAKLSIVSEPYIHTYIHISFIRLFPKQLRVW